MLLIGRERETERERERERKRINRGNPRSIPEQIGKSPEKSGKSPKGQKKTKRKDMSRSGNPPGLKPPRLAALERQNLHSHSQPYRCNRGALGCKTWKTVFHTVAVPILWKIDCRISASAPVVYKDLPPVGPEIRYTTGADQRIRVSVAIFPSSNGSVYHSFRNHYILNF